jgi:short-subunit dehydrogenase
MSRRFEGKVVVITGASAGIGAAAARRFAAEGAAVALAARGVAPLETLAKELEQGGARALAVPTDVAHPQAAQRLLAHVAERFGGIDVLVNNAGANKRGPIERYTPEELASVVQVNLTAPILLTRLVLPYLRTRGRGAIVNVASIAGRIPVGHEAVYSATKFGLRAFTFAMEEELHGSGITISAVSPGPVDTGFIMENLADVPDLVFAQPMSTADEVAKLILDCAADGTPERVIPQVTGYLATAAYLFPALRDVMLPMMEKRGKQAKEAYRRKRSGGAA